jgi:hypothetical protein
MCIHTHADLVLSAHQWEHEPSVNVQVEKLCITTVAHAFARRCPAVAPSAVQPDLPNDVIHRSENHPMFIITITVLCTACSMDYCTVQ